MKVHMFFEYPIIGRLLLAENDGKITHINTKAQPPQGSEEQSTPTLEMAKQQLIEYFEGTRKEFTLPLAPAGTPFQQQCWQALCNIPYGETRSYGEVASSIGSPKASRAVGLANNRNPIVVIVPCHRVIGANGALVGYGAGGIGVKAKLLELESR